MKRKEKSAVWFLVVFCGLLLNLSAQSKEVKSQDFFVLEQVVFPQHYSRYLGYVKEEWTNATKYQINFPPVSAWSTSDFHYYYFVRVEKMAGVDSLMAEDKRFYSQLKSKMGEAAFEEWNKSSLGTVDYSQYSLYTLLPELSYVPQNPRLKPEERRFANWMFFYVLDGKEKEFESVCKEFVALMKSKNYPDAWDVATASFGPQMPLYVVWFWGKDPADFYGSNYDTLLGADGIAQSGKLWEKIYALSKKVESKDAYYRPNLSYVPPPPPPPLPPAKKKK